MDISSNNLGKLCSIALRNNWIEVWDIINRKKIVNIDNPVYSTGGRRMVISNDDKTLVTGDYFNGIAGYSLSNFKEICEPIWYRSDLLNSLTIKSSYKIKNGIIIRAVEAPFICIDSKTGETRMEMDFDGEDLFEIPFSPFELRVPFEEEDDYFFLDTRINEIKYTIERNSYSISDVKVFSDNLLILEGGGNLSCYDIRTGNLRWSYQDNNLHLFRVGYINNLGEIIGIGSEMEMNKIIIFSPNGKLEKKIDFDKKFNSCEFINNDQYLVFDNGDILCLENLDFQSLYD